MHVNLKDLLAGDVVFECQNGRNIMFIVLENAKLTDGNRWWSCKVRHKDGNEDEIGESIDAGVYALRLYWQPQYCSWRTNKDGVGMGYIVIE